MKGLTMYVRLWFTSNADIKVNGTDKEVSFPIFYYNYLYIMDLLQLLHSQTCQIKRERLENTHTHAPLVKQDEICC